jgi:hypothetical protein
MLVPQVFAPELQVEERVTSAFVPQVLVPELQAE